MMKKIFLFALALSVLASCSKDDNQTPAPPRVLKVSFEAAEQLKDLVGAPIALGTIEVVGGWAAGTYPHVFWADPVAYADYMSKDKNNNTVFDDLLFCTSDYNIGFGSYYSDNAGYDGKRTDLWSGFVVSANYNRTATAVDYKNQFSAWTPKGAKGTANCLIGYYNAYPGGYAIPTIELDEPLNARSLYLANSTLTRWYAPDPQKIAPADYWYKIVIVGSLDGKETGRVDYKLVDGTNFASDWKQVDLSSLGRVDCLEFIAESNDSGEWGINVPAYFAVDEIEFAE